VRPRVLTFGVHLENRDGGKSIMCRFPEN
jgi:hypothetical protein